MSLKKQNTALVLGSGGARGLAHIGVIKVLEEQKIPIDIVTGTSIGALIGGLYASGLDMHSVEKVMSDVDKLTFAKIMKPKLFGAGFIDNNRVIEFIKNLVGDVKIEDLKIPFASVATDFITGEEVIFDKGSLIDAIISSIAIPTIFRPVYICNRYLLDGGLSNPLPISVAVNMKANKIIAVNVSPNPRRITKKIKIKRNEEVNSLLKKLPVMFSNMFPESMNSTTKVKIPKKVVKEMETKVYLPNMVNVFLQSVSISMNNLIMQHLKYNKPDVLISPKIEDYDMLDFFKGKEIIKCGYDAAQKTFHDFHLT